MADKPKLSRLLDGVQRYSMTPHGPVKGGQWLNEADVLAALITGLTRYDPDWPADHYSRSGMIPEIEGEWLNRDEVLAALEAAPVPDLVEAGKVLEGVTPGRVVQFHPSFCKEAEDTPFSEWDTSHDLSVIQPDGKRYRIGSMRHADDANFFQWCANNVPALIALAAAQAAQIAGLTKEPAQPSLFDDGGV